MFENKLTHLIVHHIEYAVESTHLSSPLYHIARTVTQSESICLGRYTSHLLHVIYKIQGNILFCPRTILVTLGTEY